MKINWLKNKKVILPILAVGLMSIPTNQASAAWSIIDSIGDAVLFIAVGWIFALIRGILANLLQLFGAGVDAVLSIKVGDAPVVANMWDLVRDFANMFFIIILIVMAFSTIFSISKYDFRTLIVRFLIAVLLINFSLVIGNIIIDWTQSLSNVFMDSIGSVGNRLGQIYVFGTRYTAAPTGSIATGQASTLTNWQELLATFGDIAMLFIAMISMAVLFVMVVVRVPVLWALLIFSPIAWAAYILPNTNFISKKWWSTFMSWNIFLPVYLFFIYIGLYIGDPARRTSLLAVPSNATTLNVRLEDVFFYILIGLILIYGAKFAMSSARAGGAGAVAGWAWGKGWAMSKYGGLAASRRIPGIKQVQPMYQAGQQWWQQVQTRQKRALEERSDIWAKKFGVEGADAKRFMKNVEEALRVMKDKKLYDDRRGLEEKIMTGTAAEKIAAGKLLKEFHVEELNPEQIENVYKAYSDNKLTAEASKFLAGVNYKKLSRAELERIKNLSVHPGYADQFSERVTDALIEKGPQDVTELVSLLKRYSGERKNEAIVAALKKVKDFRESLGKSDANALFNDDLFQNNLEAKRVMSESIIKKGFFGRKELAAISGIQLDDDGRVTGVNIDDRGVGGIFENNLQREQTLNSAKDTEFVAAIEFQRHAGLLRDAQGNYLYENPQQQRQNTAAIENDVREAIRQQAQRKSITQILKMSTDTLKNQDFQGAIEPNLDTNSIRTITMNPEYTSAKGGALENVMEMIRERDLVSEKINPLRELLEGGTPNRPNGLVQITDRVRNASNDKSLQDAVKEGLALQKRANALLTEIDKNRFAPATRKDQVDALFNTTTSNFEEAVREAKGRLAPPKNQPQSQPQPQKPQKSNPQDQGPKIILSPEEQFKVDKEEKNKNQP